MKYRIGLDIGIGSVGWAVLQNDPKTEEPVSIIKLGVRTFNSNEIQKTGESAAVGRRELRGIRRRRRRKAYRVERAKDIFSDKLKVKDEDLQKAQKEDVFMLRTKALDEKISLAELERVYLNILKRRGFKSNRKNIQSSKEEGNLILSIKNNKEFLQQSGYRTLGEAFFKDSKFNKTKIDQNGKTYKIYSIRNHGGNYENCFDRQTLCEELKQIFEKQQKYYKELTNDLTTKLIEIFETQRNFDEGPGKPSPYSAKYAIGNCTFYPEEKRAPKESYTFEYFNALSKLNNLKIDDEKLSDAQIEQLINEIKQKEKFTFEQVRKLLKIEKYKTFNLCRYGKKKNGQVLTQEESEKETLVSMSNSYKIRKALSATKDFNIDVCDEIALMLSTCKSDSTIDAYIKNSQLLNSLSEDQKQKIKEINCDKFCALSFKAMKQIIPFLEKGQRYDQACISAGFNHSSFQHEKKKYLKGAFVDETLQDITSNVVKRSVRQTLKVLNEIIKQYGSPQYLTIELANELSKNHQDRKKIEKIQNENFEKNQLIVKKLQDEFHLTKPSGQDILKYRLYEDQKGKCMYSGKTIDINRLFEPNYVQIDHVLPYSRSFDDSFNNKVLVLASENQNKGNRTPYEFFGSDQTKWLEFVEMVSHLQSTKKRANLLKTKFGEEQQKEFRERNLNDTRYISKVLLNLFKDHLQMEPSAKYKNTVHSVSGSITSYLRKIWGINKLRDDGDIHHCVDATIIAVSTDSQIQRITAFNKLKDTFVQDKKREIFVNVETGEVMTEQEKKEYENNNLDILREKIPYPYEQFKQELALRAGVHYQNREYSTQEQQQLLQLGYGSDELPHIKPVFISRMKTIKQTGAIHEETFMSSREYAKTGKLVKTVKLEKLKISDKAEQLALKGDKYPNKSIENYYNPQDDRLLYLKLKEHLVEKGPIAPTEVFYKPTKDGKTGPVVRTVKLSEKTGNFVQTAHGAAANDKMYRVDVFKKTGNYYLCPVYMADVYAKKLPNKVININKPWQEIDDSFEFMFSLYQNDLIKVVSKKPIKMTKNFKNPYSQKPDSIESNEWLVYYNSTGISTASITVKTHDSCYITKSLGVATLLNIEKYYVDVMGNIFKVPKEERKEL